MEVRDVTTSSPEAYKFFLKGIEEDAHFNDLDAARQSFEKAVEIDPTFAAAWWQLAWEYTQLNNPQDRDRAFKTAMNLSKRVTERERLWIESAYAEWIEKDIEKGRRILQEIADKFPKDKGAHFMLARSYGVTEDRKRCIEEFNKALTLDPNDPEIFNEFAGWYQTWGDYEKALEYDKKYVSLLPGEPNSWDSLAEAYFFIGKLDDAIANFKKALEINPDFYAPPSMSSLGYVYALKEDYPEAIKWLDKYIEVAPAAGIKQFGYFWRGFYSAWLGGLEKSLGFLQRAEDLAEAKGNKRQVAHINRLKSWIYYDRQDFELSRKYNDAWLAVYIENYPANRHYWEAVYKFALGFIELGEGKFDSAKSRLGEIESVLPQLPAGQKEQVKFLHNLLSSEVSLAEGSPRKAIDAFENVVFSAHCPMRDIN